MKKQIEIAPMLDWTDSFFRLFLRQITHHALLYTEMITEQAIDKGDWKRLLLFKESEKPLILQVGGSTPTLMKQASQKAKDLGYSGININAGCPSERVQAGSFGACLMACPEQVAKCVESITESSLPVSIKTRISLDTQENGYSALHRFVQINADAGCQKFIIHARKARLKGFSPKENRQKIPLQYECVHQLKKDFPNLEIIINGGINNLDDIQNQLPFVDGVMIGRMAYANPYFLSTIDRDFYEDNHPILSRQEIIEKMIPFIEDHIQKGFKPLNVTRHMMGLYYNTSDSKKFKKGIMDNDLNQLKNFLTSSNSD